MSIRVYISIEGCGLTMLLLLVATRFGANGAIGQSGGVGCTLRMVGLYA